MGPIVLMTDFGLKDPYVGVMKGVIRKINPDAEIIDLTHMVGRQDVYQAAILLYVSYKYFPHGSIFVCVVDPGVGSSRRALLVETRNYYFIGPDNGCLALAVFDNGVVNMYDVSESRYRLERVSYTFHGRDVFAPVAAWLSKGIPLEELGRQIDPGSMVKIEIGKPVVKEGLIIGEIIYADIFGNLMTNIKREYLEGINVKHGDKLRIVVDGREIICPFVPSFSHVGKGEYACYINSWDHFEIGINHGNAQKELRVNIPTHIEVRSI